MFHLTDHHSKDFNQKNLVEMVEQFECMLNMFWKFVHGVLQFCNDSVSLIMVNPSTLLLPNGTLSAVRIDRSYEKKIWTFYETKIPRSLKNVEKNWGCDPWSLEMIISHSYGYMGSYLSTERCMSQSKCWYNLVAIFYETIWLWFFISDKITAFWMIWQRALYKSKSLLFWNQKAC